MAPGMGTPLRSRAEGGSSGLSAWQQSRSPGRGAAPTTPNPVPSVPCVTDVPRRGGLAAFPRWWQPKVPVPSLLSLRSTSSCSSDVSRGSQGEIRPTSAPFPAAWPSPLCLLAEHGPAVGSSPVAAGGVRGHGRLRSRGCAESSEGPGRRAARGQAACSPLWEERTPIEGAPCASKGCSWPSSAAELCHSSAQMLNPRINWRRTSVHKHVRSWKAPNAQDAAGSSVRDT